MVARLGSDRKAGLGALRVVRATAAIIPPSMEEPKPDAVLPPCPAWLTSDAKAEYHRIGQLLFASSVMTAVDGHALAMVASSYSTWVEAEKAVLDHGLMVKGRDGSPTVNPFRRVANDAHDRTRQLLIEFGMTPASRTRVKKMQAPAVTASDDAWDMPAHWWEVTG